MCENVQEQLKKNVFLFLFSKISTGLSTKFQQSESASKRWSAKNPPKNSPCASAKAKTWTKATWSKKSTSKTQDKSSTKKHLLSNTSKKSPDPLNDISHLSQYKNKEQSLLLNYYFFILFFWCFFCRLPFFLVFNGVIKIFYFYFFSFRTLLPTFLHLFNSFRLSLHFVVHPPGQRSVLLLLTFQHILKSIVILTLNLFQFAHLSNTIHLLVSFTGIGMHPDDKVV